MEAIAVGLAYIIWRMKIMFSGENFSAFFLFRDELQGGMNRN